MQRSKKQLARTRPIQHVTLNPVLVERLRDIGRGTGEKRLSAMIDAAMTEYVARHWRSPAPAVDPAAVNALARALVAALAEHAGRAGGAGE